MVHAPNVELSTTSLSVVVHLDPLVILKLAVPKRLPVVPCPRTAQSVVLAPPVTAAHLVQRRPTVVAASPASTANAYSSALPTISVLKDSSVDLVLVWPDVVPTAIVPLRNPA